MCRWKLPMFGCALLLVGLYSSPTVADPPTCDNKCRTIQYYAVPGKATFWELQYASCHRCATTGALCAEREGEDPDYLDGKCDTVAQNGLVLRHSCAVG